MSLRERERERWEMKCDKEKEGEISGKVSKRKKGKECHKIFPFAGKGKGINVGRIKNSKMGSPKGKLKPQSLKKTQPVLTENFAISGDPQMFL